MFAQCQGVPIDAHFCLIQRYIKSVTESEHIAAGIATGADSTCILSLPPYHACLLLPLAEYLQIVVKPAASFHEKGEISSEDLEDLNVDIQDLLEVRLRFHVLLLVSYTLI